MYKAEHLIRKLSNDFRDEFLNSIDIFRDEIDIDKNYNIKNFELFLSLLSQFKPIVFSSVAESAKECEKPKESIHLNLDKEISMNEVNNLSNKMISNLSNAQMDSIKQVIQNGIRDDLSYKAVAKNIKSSIGLNSQQVKLIDNLKQNLANSNATKSQIEKIVEKKTESLIKTRAQTIALTESARAVNSGRRLIQKQMFDDGDLGDDTKQRWLTASDERTCFLCGPMHNQLVGMNELFTVGDGTKIVGPIVHPGCRCIVILEF